MEKKKGKIKSFLEEFKKFITRGNVLDMAVGVIVGGAFTAIVTALSENILKPLINWLLALIIGKNGLEGAITMLSPAWVADQPGVIDLENSIYIDWGAFISSIINFLLIAFVLFMIVRTMNRIAEAQERMVDGLDLDEKKAIARIRITERVSREEARAIYNQRVEDAKAAKAEAARIAAEEAAAAAAAAAEKETANTRLLEEIRDLLKNK